MRRSSEPETDLWGCRLGHGERVLTQQTEDVTILLKLNNGAHYTLNEVGGRLWELLDGNRSVSSVVATLYEGDSTRRPKW